MGFRIFVAGVLPRQNYNYVRDNQPDDDIFEAADVISALRSSGPSVAGVGAGAASYAGPTVSGAYREGVRQVATVTLLHTLKSVVSLLAIPSSSRSGWIAVSPRLTRTLWPDTVQFARYNFTPRVNPGAEFIETIAPALTETDMNNWGVLRSMTWALAEYQNRIPNTAVPMVSIELTK